MLNISKIISRFIRNSSQREIDKLKLIVEKINSWEPIIKKMPDKSFPAKTLDKNSKGNYIGKFNSRSVCLCKGGF